MYVDTSALGGVIRRRKVGRGACRRGVSGGTHIPIKAKSADARRHQRDGDGGGGGSGGERAPGGRASAGNQSREEAQAEASKAIAGAQATIEAEKKAAVAELKQTVANLSIDIAEKIVKSELSNKDKQLELVETMLKDANVN